MIHELINHTAVTFNFRGNIVGTANLKHLDPENSKYTIAFNRDKTRAWYFFTSKDIFFKWEAPSDYQLLEMKVVIDKREENKALLLYYNRLYKPVEVKIK